jgi:selenocysteine lyase/cysteine desulfurase
MRRTAALRFEDWGVDWYGFSLYKVFGPHCALLCLLARRRRAAASLNHEWMTRRTPAARLEPGAWPYELAWGAAAVPEYLEALGGVTARGHSSRSPRTSAR